MNDRARYRMGRLILVVAVIGTSPGAVAEPDRAAHRPGTRFQDPLASGGKSPELVVVRGGTFTIGSPPSEEGHRANEGPQRRITVPAFALGRTEVTRGEFAAFVAATGYVTDAEKNTTPPGKPPAEGCFGVEGIRGVWLPGKSWRNAPYPQDESHPVVCVSWDDANAYVRWLGKETGQRYRLPTEAEFEYANRAGSTAPWPWGDDPDGGCATANGSDETNEAAYGLVKGVFLASSNCTDGHATTAPVASFAANAFGLHDTTGNVSEWMQDCSGRSHADMPDDGAAHEPAGCVLRVNRGACFSDEPVWMRSAIRLSLTASLRYLNLGFRVARDLEKGDAPH